MVKHIYFMQLETMWKSIILGTCHKWFHLSLRVVLWNSNDEYNKTWVMFINNCALLAAAHVKHDCCFSNPYPI